MASSIDELTIHYEEDGVTLVKELDKEVISKGAWTTILYKYQQWERSKEKYGPIRYTIRRYRKMDGVYRQQGKFNISSTDQAKKIIETLQKWIDESD